LGGCECDSVCGATATDAFNCDWCYTKNNCGSYTFGLGYWDWCLYPRNSSENADWNEKSINTWAKITADTSSGYYPNILGLLQVSVQTSFDDNWEVMPSGRKKYIHSVGAHCLVNFEVSTGSYTGIFKQGNALGIIRMGSAGEVGGGGMAPGIGFKFMRTNQLSANWVSLFDLDGQKTWNFFKHNQTNHIRPPTGATAILAQKFKQSSDCVVMVGLSDAARYDQDGNEVANPVFPYMLNFVPTYDAKNLMPDDVEQENPDLINHLEKISYGFHLFDVYAKSSPTADEEYLGKMKTSTQCYGSKYGDEHLYFRHQRMEEDFAVKPQWLTEMDLKSECGTTDVGPVPPTRCIDKTPPSLSVAEARLIRKKKYQN